MSAVTDVIDGQVDAYRDRDLDRYLGFYADDAIVTNGAGKVVMSGIADLRDQYGKSFRSNPAVQIEIARRIAVGDYVVDEEHLANLGDPPQAGEIHAVVAYHVCGGLISRVLLLASSRLPAPAEG